MASLQDKKTRALAELERALDHCNLSPGQLAKDAGISYYAAYRALRRGVSNYTKTAWALCTCFGIEPENSQEPQTGKGATLQELQATLADVWDGSEPHAELLSKLIRSTQPYRIRGR